MKLAAGHSGVDIYLGDFERLTAAKKTPDLAGRARAQW